MGAVITIVLIIDKETNSLKVEPQISLQGVAGINHNNGTMQEIKEHVVKVVHNLSQNRSLVKSVLIEALNSEMKRFFQREAGSRPIIMPTIIEM